MSIQNCQSGLDWIYQEYFVETETNELPNSIGVEDFHLVQEALSYISPDEYSIWRDVGMAIKSAGLPLEVWESWSSNSQKFKHGECAKKWKTFRRNELRLGTLFYLAKQHGFKFPKKEFSLDDIGNAERFVCQFGEVFRWLSASKSWLEWIGTHWKQASEDRVMKFAKRTARLIYTEAAQQEDSKKANEIAKWAKQSASKQRLEAMVKLAKSELEVDTLSLDKDKFLLNCLNGTIDLRTGELLAHNPTDLITKLILVSYNPKSDAKRFIEFLSEIFGSNQSLINYCQCVFGYCLTGSVKEQKFFILYGTGQNGKSTLISTISQILGDYAQEADASLLIAKQVGNGATEDVARLRGVRFATTIETDEGVRFNEARVKQLTGGDRLTARYLYGHLTEFEPTHKILVISNYKPTIKSQSHAMWRRIVLIPFERAIPKSEIDKDLPEKLKEEFEGILAWLVEGSLEWQRNGLPEVPVIEEATKEYKSEMDNLSIFLKDCCETGIDKSEQSERLFKQYQFWCHENGEKALTRKVFSNRMRDKGFEIRKTKSCNLWSGLTLLAEAIPFFELEHDFSNSITN